MNADRRVLSKLVCAVWIAVTHGSLSERQGALGSNKCFERTAGKRCLPVHSGLRPTSAAQAQRYAPERTTAVHLNMARPSGLAFAHALGWLLHRRQHLGNQPAPPARARFHAGLAPPLNDSLFLAFRARRYIAPVPQLVVLASRRTGRPVA